MPTEIHVGTAQDESGVVGILTIQTTEGLLEIALDHQAAEAVADAVATILARFEIGLEKRRPGKPG